MKTPAAMLKRLLPLIACFCLAAPLSAADKKIVLIAGPPSHGPGELEFNAGVLLLKKCLDGVPGVKVEEYRKKAAGLGGLFNAGGKKADAMYALLLENEALEEALYAQNEKLRQERTDSLKEQMRATGYRRVLMSQLLNDQRIKDYVAEILADERHLPSPSSGNTKALPPERAHTDHPT